MRLALIEKFKPVISVLLILSVIYATETIFNVVIVMDRTRLSLDHFGIILCFLSPQTLRQSPSFLLGIKPSFKSLWISSVSTIYKPLGHVISADFFYQEQKLYLTVQ